MQSAAAAFISPRGIATGICKWPRLLTRIFNNHLDFVAASAAITAVACIAHFALGQLGVADMCFVCLSAPSKFDMQHMYSNSCTRSATHVVLASFKTSNLIHKIFTIDRRLTRRCFGALSHPRDAEIVLPLVR